MRHDLDESGCETLVVQYSGGDKDDVRSQKDTESETGDEKDDMRHSLSPNRDRWTFGL
jgi:hypothetical protein